MFSFFINTCLPSVLWPKLMSCIQSRWNLAGMSTLSRPANPCKISSTAEWHVILCNKWQYSMQCGQSHTHPFNGPLSGTTRVSRYQRGKTNLDFTEAETVSGSGISWAICKSAPRFRKITMPAPQHSVFYRPDALPAAQPTVSKYCGQSCSKNLCSSPRQAQRGRL